MDRQRSSGKYFDLHVGHWNVRSLKSSQVGEDYNKQKVKDLADYMEINNMDILGISETHIQADGLRSDQIGDQFVFLFSNLPPVPVPQVANKTEKLTHTMKNLRPGVGLLVRKSLYDNSKSVTSPDPTRMLGRIITSPNGVNVLVIEAYSPTDQLAARKNVDMPRLRRCKEETKEKFYRDLQKMIAENKGKVDDVVVMGDFNGRTGWSENWSHVIGNIESAKVKDPNRRSVLPSIPSDNGLRLLNFCECNELVIANNAFERPHDDKWTWQHPNQTANRIDFIIAGAKWEVKDFNIHPGKTIGRVKSDHRLIRAKLQLSITPGREPTVNDLTGGLQSLRLLPSFGAERGVGSSNQGRRSGNSAYSHERRRREYDYRRTCISPEEDDVDMPMHDLPISDDEEELREEHHPATAAMNVNLNVY